MKKDYGVKLVKRTGKQRPGELAIVSKGNAPTVIGVAKRVITTHSKVIKALANR